jgi:hypothetical protein
MRAAQITVFIFCVSLAIGVLGSMGWFSLVGVQPDAGIETQQAEDDLSEPGASSAGSDEFSIVRGAIDTLNALRLVTTQTSSALINLGTPAPIAYAVHSVVVVTWGVGIALLVRGVVR